MGFRRPATLLPEGVSNDLNDAQAFIGMVRMRHQARQIEAGIAPDNNVEPKRLSSFERRHLRNAFQLVDKAQSFLRFRYTTADGIPTFK